MEYKLITLLNAAKKVKGEKNNYRLAVLADSASQLLAGAVKGYGALQGFPIEIFEADYDQIEIQASDENSELYRFKPQAVLLFMCTQRLYEEFCRFTDKHLFAEYTVNKIFKLQEIINKRSNAVIIQFLFEEINDCIFGNYGLKVQASFAFQIKKINYLIMEKSVNSSACFPLDINNVKSKMKEGIFFDPSLYCSSKMAISPAALPLTAKNVMDIVKAVNGHSKKCVILDLDNTLWGGVIGDIGMENIELGELGIGHAFTDFQMWLKQLKERGIILCICSKNDEETAKEPFIKHADMVLRLEDITMFVANWEDKASNIRHIQKTVNIGMDSMVFIDDNPFERNLVRDLIPEIIVPDLPADPALYKCCLESLNLFETASFSQNDRERTRQYQTEVGRIQYMSDFSDYREYIRKLDMKSKAGPFEKSMFSRIAQLTLRSNQFNMRTVRYSEADIERIAADQRFLTLYFTLSDKFGDQGLVSILIMEKRADALFIDTFLMSCRVLKRGMEEFVINSMVELAKTNQYDFIEGEYIPTSKNQMVKNLYAEFGFQATGANKYKLDVKKYSQRETQIQGEDTYDSE